MKRLTLLLLFLLASPAVAQRYATVCSGGSCRLVEVVPAVPFQSVRPQRSTLASLTQTKVVSLSSLCECDCQDCTCNSQSTPVETVTFCVYQQPVYQPVRRVIQSQPVRGLFGRLRCR